jgi:peptide/nickel transport system substrate-binding protein
MKTTRRSVLGTGLAAGALAAAYVPKKASAQSAPPANKTIRAVMHGDLRVFDPIWTTANISGYHGAMVYDMLFMVDEKFAPQPQMVDKWSLSDNKKLYTFQLRDGLGFHDGTPVTAADCVASIRRWAQVDGGGQAIMERVSDISKKDDKSFVISLKEPFGPLIDQLGRPITRDCFIMREKDAMKPATEQVSENIGSGPFLWNARESKPGVQYVYDKNPKYMPRSEPASGLAGGHVVKVERVIWENITDQQTAMAALQAGEIDFYETPPLDLVAQLESDPNIKLDVFAKGGNVVIMRANFLHKPFSDARARQALLYLVDQNAFMKATFGDSKWYKPCPSIFGNNTAYTNDANTDWFRHGVDLDKARQLFKDSGYNGDPVVVLQATNIAYMSNSEQLITQQLKKIGVNASLAPSDWGGVVTRRAVKAPPDQGGWNLFVTSGTDYSYSDPIGLADFLANGDKAWYGWPKSDEFEALRAKWADATNLNEQKALARQMQTVFWDFVPEVICGSFLQPQAYRANTKGWIGMPEILPFWNVEKT